MSMNLVPGRKRFTVDSVVGASGKPIRIFSTHIISGSTAGKVRLRSGTAISDVSILQIDGVANSGTTENFAGGMRFENGCFADIVANVSSISIVYTHEF